MHRLSFAVLSLALASTIALAGEEGKLTLVTERVVVFKDGYALVVKRASGVADESGVLFTEEVPDAAVLGTFWALPISGEISSMDAGFVETTELTDEEVLCADYVEILVANKGCTATVELEDGERLEGEIREVLTDERPVNLPVSPDPFRSSLPAPVRTTNRLIGSLFVLTGGTGDRVIPVSRIRRLDIKEIQLTRIREVREERRTKRLSFRFRDGAGAKEVRILYFRPGIRWIPTYRLDLDEPKQQVDIWLQAEILNEAEDLVGVPFDLVVGVPNFRFKEVVSPFVLEAALSNALRQAAPQLMGQQAIASRFSNSIQPAGFGARSGEWRGAEEGVGETTLPEDLTTGRNQDLYVYSLPPMTVRKGHRAAAPLLTTRAPYRDVYTWDLGVARHDREVVQDAGNVSPLALLRNQVWHQVEIENPTSGPWTTGAAMVLSGGRPIAQELLTYTSAGSRVRLPLTVAVDIRADFTEEEIDRELSAMQWLRQSYARIDKRCRLGVVSMKGEPVEFEVTCRLGGTAEEVSDDGKITVSPFEADDWRNYQGAPAVNNHSEIRWKTTLEPGKPFTPWVRVRYYARH